MLRKHQREFSLTIDRIIAGSAIRTIYCHVTPGGGKSLIPIMAGRLIKAGLADKLMWIAPRLSLTDQAEREFVNPYFRTMFNHSLKIRQSTNENNPCRSLDGFATTYNAAGLDEGLLVEQFRHYRYILIMDEFHHIQEDSLWHKQIAPLWALAKYRIPMTGTLERGDQSRIAFTPYRGHGKNITPFLQNSHDTAVIRYTRADALAEKAIIPLAFHLSDGSAEWEDRRGKTVKVSSMDKMNEEDANKALYTALKTEYADHLLSTGIRHWQEHAKKYPGSKCLVVTSNITEAKRHIASLSGLSRCDIATSEDSAAALKVINKMKANKLDVIVTVAMAYEGLNIPEISHIICLTRIRSVPWIEQMTARANRISPSGGPYDEQTGHIFAPADPLFKQTMAKIEAEQAPILQERTSRRIVGASEDGGGFFLTPAPGGITPLSSALTGKCEMLLATGIPVPEKTASEQEAELRDRIDNHIKRYAHQNRFKPQTLNYEVLLFMRKKRQDMTIKELENCLAHVRAKYPLSFIRGTGHRCSTKAQPFPCVWR
jgi:superfamily II DNA or RNA helicase